MVSSIIENARKLLIAAMEPVNSDHGNRIPLQPQCTGNGGANSGRIPAVLMIHCGINYLLRLLHMRGGFSPIIGHVKVMGELGTIGSAEVRASDYYGCERIMTSRIVS